MTAGAGPVELRSPSGLRVQVNRNGSIRRIDHGDVTVNLFLGSEVEGVDPEVMRICDEIVEIPQFGSKESLNVSVAAGVAMYALRGQIQR